MSTGRDRVALVVGNGAYKFAPPLANTKSDAEAVAGAFERLGFSKIFLHFDVDQVQLSGALADFGESAADADIAVVYFAGHGVEIDGENYLLPIGTELSHVNRVKFETQPLGNVVSAVSSAKTLGLVIVDACRDNPFRGRMKGAENTRSATTRGLASVEPIGNTLVAYAAKHGTFARDGDVDGHSPFTRALLDYLERPNLELRLLFGKVRDAVLDATARQQEPHLYGSLGGKEIFLNQLFASRNPSSPSDVFISYARSDKEAVKPLAKILQQEGLDVFWDQDLIVGDDWREVIKKRLGAARCVVAVWSANSVNSDWVKWEAARGYDRGILIPISIDGQAPARVFDEIQTEDFSNWDGSARDVRVGRLLTGIRGLIERTRPDRPVAEPALVRSVVPPAIDPLPVPKRSPGMDFGKLVLGGVAAVALVVAGVALMRSSDNPRSDASTPDKTHADTITTAMPAPAPPPVVYQGPPPVVYQAPPPPAPEPVVLQPPPPPPKVIIPDPVPPPAVVLTRLEFKDCAIVLESVKTCETLRTCSDGDVRDNFTTGEQGHIAALSGTAVFTSANFYAHCKDVCRQRNYRLKPARQLLCGY